MKTRLIQASAHDTGLPEKSVQCIVTSPPYWGLRKYEGDQAIEWPSVSYSPMPGLPELEIEPMTCELGLEPTPEAYVGHIVLVFREMWRVLRDDGIAWCNLGDSYAQKGGKQEAESLEVLQERAQRKGYDVGAWGAKTRDGQGIAGRAAQTAVSGPKPKDLCGIPWRVAFVLQADGWVLRSDVIWAKPNPMPESVTDRPTKAHEYLFMLAKAKQYYYDADAVREAHKEPWRGKGESDRQNWNQGGLIGRGHVGEYTDGIRQYNPAGRNRRTVWTIATQPTKAAHFATYPEKLVEPCIRAGSKPGDTILDPFSGSGTTGRVAMRLGRSYIGVDISQEYHDEIAEQRLGNIQMEMI